MCLVVEKWNYILAEGTNMYQSTQGRGCLAHHKTDEEDWKSELWKEAEGPNLCQCEGKWVFISFYSDY